MIAAAQTQPEERPTAQPGTLTLVLLLEPTPYVLPRAIYLQRAADLNAEVVFTFRNGSQPWGQDADVQDITVLLDSSVFRLRQFARVLRLLRHILAGRYTVAHVAGWGHWVTLCAILALKLRGVLFAVESDTQLQPTRSGYKERVKEILYPILLNWPSAVLPGGSRQAKFFRHYGVPENRIHVAHMTVDTQKLRSIPGKQRDVFRAEQGLSPEAVVFLYVGRFVPQKGIRLLADVSDVLTRACRHANLVFAGAGELQQEVQALCARLPEQARYLGRLSTSEVIQWMRASDILVLPSLSEQWGLVVNEAMLCGLPIVASDRVGCVDDLVHHGKNGFIFPAGDSARLAFALTSLAEDGELRRRMGAESARIIEPWTMEREAEAIRSALVQMSGAQ
ncbi:MAG TPA: glycosyltransferase family 4 protein [Clostridia bacterium]|nr:glycosyltransferase family 4 protein [Clostridia bacterium]